MLKGFGLLKNITMCIILYMFHLILSKVRVKIFLVTGIRAKELKYLNIAELSQGKCYQRYCIDDVSKYLFGKLTLFCLEMYVLYQR